MDMQTSADPEDLVAMDADPSLEGSDYADDNLGDGKGPCLPYVPW